MRKGQSFLEYSLLIGCVAITVFAMQAYFKRGIQGIIKSTSDDLGSPVLQAMGIDPQTEGGRTVGWDYAPDPTVTVSNQEFITNEYARGDRRFQINQDSSVTDASSSVIIPPAEYLKYGIIHSPVFYAQTFPTFADTTPSSNGFGGGFGGSNGFGGGGAAGRSGVTNSGAGGR